MYLFRSLDGDFYLIPEKELSQYKVPESELEDILKKYKVGMQVGCDDVSTDGDVHQKTTFVG